MNSEQRIVERAGALQLLDIDWWFRVYMIRGDTKEFIARDGLLANLESKARIIAEKYLSDEYEYVRSGFIITHFGRRGVTFSFWHWADWAGTWEYFCQAWYCYGRSIACMAPLDKKEPILCEHEIALVGIEGSFFKKIASQNLKMTDIRQRFRVSDIATIDLP